MVAKAAVLKRSNTSNKLSFNEQRELAELPQKIEMLDKTVGALHLQMADSKFYQQEAQIIAQITQQLTTAEATLAQMYARWEALEALF